MNEAVVFSPTGEVDPLQRGRAEICAFVYKECRLADESQYDAWEALLDDEMLYWVPLGGSNPDPDSKLSIIADHRQRLRNRIAQLKTQRRLAQQPASPMRRMLANIEISPISHTETQVLCNFTLHEFRVQSTAEVQVWAGRYEYRLRRREEGLRMYYKRVDLINAGDALPSLAFLI